MSQNHPATAAPASRRKTGFRRIAKLGLFALAWLAPVMSAQAAVSIDQSPLILQKPLPPDIVLMLDDSGSMSWNYMPDTARGTNSATNYVYYNPATYYEAPKKADGTSYANATFPNASTNGFVGNNIKDIQKYTSRWDYFKQSKNTVGDDNSGNCGNNNKYNCVFKYQNTATNAENYVGVSCAGFSSASCHLSTDVLTFTRPDGSTVTTTYGQNVANWFSYYQTRILTAKTGLTLAFSDLDPQYRFGFGSINGRNTGKIPSSPTPYTYNSPNNSSNKIAAVSPFGDGASGTQKANFWDWITTITPNDGTPLRSALKAVGEYYKTSQPWLTGGTGADSNTSYACRPAFTILTTDGFWNTDSDGSIGVGNVDGNNGPSITSPTNYQRIAKQPYSDTYSNTLADVAMYYWQNDLQPTLANEVPTTPTDPAYWQHMTTFTMGLGYTPTGITPSSLTIPQIFSWANTGNPPTGATTTTWPDPTSQGIYKITDLAHAAVNGHGDFFSVKSPDEFVAGLKSALKAIGESKGAGNAVTQSGTTEPTVSSLTDPLFQFRATYYTGAWTGELTAATYDTTTTPPSYKSAWSTNSWSPTFTDVSGERLSNRNVWTTKDGTGAESVAFRKASDLSSAEQTGLAAFSSSTVPAQTMLNYLLGDKTYEGSGANQLRARKTVLGDVVSSTPVYVAKPDKNLFENATFPGAGTTYQNFVSSKASRTPMVYTAANDGMLHAFRVTTGAGYDISGSSVTTNPNQPAGTEVYAYMPSAVLTQTGAGSITNLANQQYGQVNPVDGSQPVPHQYYNDGRITVQNVYFSSDSAWHTVLVGTTGRGPAKAIYALDITDPTVLMNPSTAKNALLWERSAGDGKTGSNYIGEMVGAPVIAQVKQDGATTPSWAVFVGNGYNSKENTAALLQFNLQTGALTVHTTSSTTNNGLAEPGLMQGDTNTGVSTFAFGGDLFGNLWKFDLTSSTSAGTSVFVAKDALDAPQPITSLTSLIYDSASNSTFALFGTGKYLTSDDINDPQVQTWYGLRVGMGANLAGAANTATPVVTSATTRSDLTPRYAVDAGVDRATSLEVTGDMANKAGWYMDLPQNGERIVNRTQFIAGKAVVTTLIPKVSDPCNTIPAGAVMGVDPFTGANQATDYGLGTTTITYTNAAGQQVTAKVAINGQVFAAGPAGGVTASYTADGKIRITFNTHGGGQVDLGPLDLGGGSSGRVSWRELVN